MSYSPILLIHICSGVLGCVSGAAALSFRKGSRSHRFAGKVFAIAMLTMAAAGVYLALTKSKSGDVLGGTLTLYLVSTGWATVGRSDADRRTFDWVALSVVLMLGAVTATWRLEAAGSPTGLKNGYPPGVYAFLGSIALLSVAGDVRMLVGGGIPGAQRIARHLWRMCFALFIAAASIFLARQQIFPVVLRKTGVLTLLSVLPLILMLFCLVRLLTANIYKRKSTLTGEHAMDNHPAPG